MRTQQMCNFIDQTTQQKGQEKQYLMNNLRKWSVNIYTIYCIYVNIYTIYIYAEATEWIRL